VLLHDTIVAVASGWSPSPRGLVRASGPHVDGLMATLLDHPPSEPRRVARADFRLTPELRLPVLAVLYRAPASYTGQDALEMLVPGNPVLLERVLARLLACPGTREATPGEFSARAYLAGRLTLAQAEGVAAVIGARTAAELEAADRVRRGEETLPVRAWTGEVASLLALVEAGVDFTDQEDVVPIEPADLAARLDGLLAGLGTALGAGTGAARHEALPAVVLAGAPGAGKSTLFNALLGRGRAVTGPEPGTTRDVISETLELRDAAPGAGAVVLRDTAGLDRALAARTRTDGQSQENARAALAGAGVVIHCDPSGRFVPLAGVPEGCPVLRVRTKADLAHTGNAPAASASPSALAVCALDGRNLGPLKRAIADAAWCVGPPGAAALIPRHRRALERAARALEAAAGAARVQPPQAELVAGALRAALDQLGEVTGRISPDDVIGRIFASFCIGK